MVPFSFIDLVPEGAVVFVGGIFFDRLNYRFLKVGLQEMVDGVFILSSIVNDAFFVVLEFPIVEIFKCFFKTVLGYFL